MILNPTMRLTCILCCLIGVSVNRFQYTPQISTRLQDPIKGNVVSHTHYMHFLYTSTSTMYYVL